MSSNRAKRSRTPTSLPAARSSPAPAPGPLRLMELAIERDAGLTPEYFAEAVRHLDQLPDSRLNLVLRGTGRDAAWVRAHFASWPRGVDPGAASA